MDTISKKRYLACAIILGAVIFAPLWIMSHSANAAQVPVTGLVGKGCRTATGETPSGTPESVYALVTNGSVNAVTGNYQFVTRCDPGISTAVCDFMIDGANEALTQGNAISGFPQGGVGLSSPNTITIEVGDQGVVCGTRPDGSIPGACEVTDSVNGGGADASIYINAASVQGGDILTDPAFLLSVMEHEMSHAFGADDTYPYIPQYDDNGLMSQGVNTGATWATDPMLVALIKSINSGAAITCASPVCPAGYVAVPITSANLNPYPACRLASLPPLPTPPPPPLPYCTNAQIQEGAGVDPSAFGCTMPPSITYCQQNPANVNCGSILSCNPGWTLNALGNCEQGTTTIVNAPASLQNCTCTGSNLVCTFSDGTVTTNYDSSCVNQQGCNPDDPVASPDCPSNSNSSSTTSSYCEANPTDPDCVAYCAANPTDPACTGDNSGNDPNFCEQNPTDPSCTSSSGSGSSNGNGDCTIDGTPGGDESYLYNPIRELAAAVTLDCD